MKHRRFDVVVVGGGHAGTEAALAAHRMGAQTALVTHRFSGLGEMSCNPAIGGIGKGHIVREIDALDGAMGWAADQAGIQFRLLNRSRGPATQGPRAQVDRALYRAAIQRMFLARADLAVIEDEVVDLSIQGDSLAGVLLARGGAINAAAVVLTTGTFLRGMIHIGAERTAAGRFGDPASTRLAERIGDLGLPLGRLKTGTPPRLDSRSIDWTVLQEQRGDEEPVLLSFLSDRPLARQVSCGVTHTNPATHGVIRANITRSAMYGDWIVGPGPRYCPSIEDKVVRFAEKTAHQVFLEPEGLTGHVTYPNGISTSLPPDIQAALVHSMQGLEKAIILRPGYAIEYDYVDPRALDRTLGARCLEGLFLAGQINGTTGYEEAAGQGLIAGLNAACRALDRDPLVLDRAQAYIGVMIDDLVTKGVTEPYRMFTSRAEFRLQLRADNADQRLTALGISLGCVGARRQSAFRGKIDGLKAARSLAAAISVTPPVAARLGAPVTSDGARRSLLELLAVPGVDPGQLFGAFPELSGVPPSVREQLLRDASYAPYLARQALEVARLRRDEAVRLPERLDYIGMPGLSAELQAKLDRVRPATLGQAGRIEGMTPAALTLILMRARQAGAAAPVK